MRALRMRRGLNRHISFVICVIPTLTIVTAIRSILRSNVTCLAVVCMHLELQRRR